MKDNQLKWHELYDDNDRPYWEAASIYHDDGCPFYFRIRLKGKYYREDSDSELVGVVRNWLSLEAAKSDIQSDHDRMIKAETK